MPEGRRGVEEDEEGEEGTGRAGPGGGFNEGEMRGGARALPVPI